MFVLENIVRKSIQKVKAYSSARDEFSGGDDSYVFLDANENAEGSVGTDISYNRYPDPYQRAVKTELAKIHGIDVSQIFIGNGSDEAIDLIYRIFCEPGEDNVIMMPPTYGMYTVSAGINNIGVQAIPMTPDFQLDTSAILAAVNDHTKVIWVCSPNNPSGNTIHREDIETLLSSFNGLVVVDEAYIDFCMDKSTMSLLAKYPNLIIMQTFSKAWGLANLRVGKAFASKQIIDIFNKVKPPYNVNGYSQQVAYEALLKNEEKLTSVEKIISNRTTLTQNISTLGHVYSVYPSEANFILVKMKDARKVYEQLVEKKIILRDRSKVILCDECLRITVGTEEENNILIEALKKTV